MLIFSVLAVAKMTFARDLFNDSVTERAVPRGFSFVCIEQDENRPVELGRFFFADKRGYEN